MIGLRSCIKHLSAWLQSLAENFSYPCGILALVSVPEPASMRNSGTEYTHPCYARAALQTATQPSTIACRTSAVPCRTPAAWTQLRTPPSSCDWFPLSSFSSRLGVANSRHVNRRCKWVDLVPRSRWSVLCVLFIRHVDNHAYQTFLSTVFKGMNAIVHFEPVL